jgi:hypothetical protein
MIDLYKSNGSSPPRRCGGTNGARCWRATLRARHRVDHWCDDINRHLGACVCAGCGSIIATRPMMPALSIQVYDERARAAERAAVDDATIRSSNAEIRGWMCRFGVRLVLLIAGGRGLMHLGIDGRAAAIMVVMVAVIFACLWYLTRDES